jgi:integrase
MAQFEVQHPIGTKARLAFALARYTGLGRSEIAAVGPQHVVDGEIVIVGQKTGVGARITMHPELRAVIEATPLTGLAAFLVNKAGRPFTPTSLSDLFRAWCDEAGLPEQYTLHGLRHAMGDALAESGSNPNEVASVLGHASVRSALHYTPGADRKAMARSAMARLIGRGRKGHSGNPEVSNHNPGLTLGNGKPLKDRNNG